MQQTPMYSPPTSHKISYLFQLFGKKLQAAKIAPPPSSFFLFLSPERTIAWEIGIWPCTFRCLGSVFISWLRRSFCAVGVLSCLGKAENETGRGGNPQCSLGASSLPEPRGPRCCLPDPISPPPTHSSGSWQRKGPVPESQRAEV